MTMDTRHVVWFEELRRRDVPRVGGKNASLGEMVGSLAERGVKVPPGFATTADAYWRFVEHNGLSERIASVLADLEAGRMALPGAGQAIRSAFLRADWPKDIAAAITSAYAELCRRSDRPRTCPMRASRDNRRPISISGGRGHCSMHAGAVTPRCSPIGRLATVRRKASTIRRSRFPSESREWCAPISAARA